MSPDAVEPSPNLLEHRIICVANQVQSSQFMEVAHMIDSPVTCADYCDVRRVSWSYRLIGHLSWQVTGRSLFDQCSAAARTEPGRCRQLCLTLRARDLTGARLSYRAGRWL